MTHRPHRIDLADRVLMGIMGALIVVMLVFLSLVVAIVARVPPHTWLSVAVPVGGVLLLAAAVLALVAANVPGLSDAYEDLRELTFGPSSLGARLDLEHWAADGLLAIFFFVAGLEVKRELVVGCRCGGR